MALNAILKCWARESSELNLFNGSKKERWDCLAEIVGHQWATVFSGLIKALYPKYGMASFKKYFTLSFETEAESMESRCRRGSQGLLEKCILDGNWTIVRHFRCVRWGNCLVEVLQTILVERRKSKRQARHTYFKDPGYRRLLFNFVALCQLENAWKAEKALSSKAAFQTYLL